MAKGTFDNNDNENKQDKDDEFDMTYLMKDIGTALADVFIKTDFSPTDLRLAALLFKL